MMETLETKGGQLRQCVLEILATAEKKRSGNCTLRASLTQGTGCFHFLGSPAFCGGFPYAKGSSDKALTANEERSF